MPHRGGRVHQQRYVATRLGQRTNWLTSTHLMVRRLHSSESHTWLPHRPIEGLQVNPTLHVHVNLNG
jgi:hypothetical protein